MGIINNEDVINFYYFCKLFKNLFNNKNIITKKMTTIEFLPTTDFKILKVIQIEGPEWNRFSGYLPYLRTFNPKQYDHKKGDILDEKILEALQHYFPNSFLRYNLEIVFKGQLEDNLNNIEGGSRKEITLQFSPDIPYELVPQLVGKTLYAYPWKFEIRLLFSENNDRKNLINGFYICSLPYDKLDDIVKTITPS